MKINFGNGMVSIRGTEYMTSGMDFSNVKLTIKEAVQLRNFLNQNHKLLRPNKDWSKCSYEDHADDCNCRGAGGGR